VLQAAGTDAIYLAESGIPTYGLSGMFVDPDLSNIHGLNERIRVQSLYDGRDFLSRWSNCMLSRCAEGGRAMLSRYGAFSARVLSEARPASNCSPTAFVHAQKSGYEVVHIPVLTPPSSAR